MCKVKIVLFFQTDLARLPSPHSHALVILTSLRPTVGSYYQNAKCSLSLLADVALASACYVPGADVIRPGYDNLRPLAFPLLGGICLIL